MSLADKYKNKKILLKEAVELLKNKDLFHKEKHDIIQSVIQLEIDNFLTGKDKEELKGVIEMTGETEKIIKESFEYVHKKYEAEAIEKARKNGKEEEKREIAKKLKSILPPKEISRITGLSINAILLL